jgi:Ser/Thr protein kinase RdoA (MazF antagonist)
MTASPKSHGLDGTLVNPDWLPLTLAELRTLLAEFPALGPLVRIASVSPRPFSAAGVIETQSGFVFVKSHHVSIRDREGLLEEHRFLGHLRSRGASVPRVLASVSGETAVVIGNATYEIHEIPAGVDLYRAAISWTPFLSAVHARSAGESLARLHLAALEFSAPPRRPRPLVASFSIFASADPASAIRSYFAMRPDLASHAPARACADRALELLTLFHAELAPLLSALPPLWTHNDLHASNLFWSDATPSARAAAIIDFGLSDRTNAVHDLAHAIERNIVEWLFLVNDPAHPESVPVHLDHLDALLAGYESVRPLSPEERAALAPMTALCHAEFALSEADYFLGILQSPERAPMAYDGWLVGHARWFRGAGGKLIDAIRRWAASPARLAEASACR